MIVSATLSTSITELGSCQHDLCTLRREYIITPSLQDGLLFLTYSRHFVPGRLRRLRRARQLGVCATIFCGRDVGLAESGYHRAVPPGRGRQTAIKLTLMG
jgi:hypothetical protein